MARGMIGSWWLRRRRSMCQISPGLHWFVAVPLFHLFRSVSTSRTASFCLKYSIRAIEQCLEYAVKEGYPNAYAVKEGYPNAWPYYKVATWKQNHINKIPRQKDRASSTLFLIKYIQHWTGQRMEKHFTEADIKTCSD